MYLIKYYINLIANIGEVIIREKPFATVLYPEFQATHCLTCFKFISEDPIQCKSCNKV